MEYMIETMKNKHIILRVDEATHALIREASVLSGASVSEIVRRGALNESSKLVYALKRGHESAYDVDQSNTISQCMQVLKHDTVNAPVADENCESSIGGNL